MRRQVFRLVILAGLCVIAFPGCAYFRLGDRSTEELQKAREEQKDNNNRFFKPGTTLYSE